MHGVFDVLGSWRGAVSTLGTFCSGSQVVNILVLIKWPFNTDRLGVGFQLNRVDLGYWLVGLGGCLTLRLSLHFPDGLFFEYLSESLVSQSLHVSI